MIRSWVLGNEAHENRNGVLLFYIIVCENYGGFIFYRKEVIIPEVLDYGSQVMKIKEELNDRNYCERPAQNT